VLGRLRNVVIDCPDPEALAAFYAELLGLPVTSRSEDWVTIGGGGDAGAGVAFQLAPDHRPPAWPDPARPQQLHLDVTVDDLAAADARVLELGAVSLSREEPTFWVYADPAGHPFCLVTGED
jgi:catechol 2,3-dioxygenase-like lactoylglutathione lyase family enzyme